MQNELKQTDRVTVPLAERIERNIESIIAAHVTVWDVDLSELLASQRAKIAELQVECKRKDAQYEALRLAYEQSMNNTRAASDPVNACAPEQPAEEGEEGGIGIEIRVTGEGPMPPGLTAMLNDITSMLQSMARK